MIYDILTVLSWNIWLVGGLNPSEKYLSIGMISNPIDGKIKNIPNHQPDDVQSMDLMDLMDLMDIPPGYE